MDQLTRQCINTSRQLAASGAYSKAFDLYMLAFDKNPEIKTDYEAEFHDILTKLNDFLAKSTDNRMNVIFSNFERAVKVFPENVFVLNDIGKYLYKYGFYEEALIHFEKALLLDITFVNPEKNLNSVKNFLVERWHFRMLNDKIRNEAYHKAIVDTVVPYKETVLDIGTGTGLLAMYANEKKPLILTGCDGSKTMITLAENITKLNKVTDMAIINKMSTCLNAWLIGGKCSLVVTELFDAGLFGEHVLQCLSHSWQHLMLKDSQVIPNRAEFFIIGVQSYHLNRRYQLCSSAKNLLNILDLNVHLLICDETYDCEDVHLIKDLDYVTDSQSVLKVNFNDLNNIQATLNKAEPYTAKLKAIKSGEINVIVGFFNLYLTDDITITTDPRSDNRANAWQQAIFFDNIPESVQENETREILFLVNGGKLILLPNCGEIIRISPDTLRFLNDTEYIDMITGCMGMASIYLGQIANITEINVVDLCPFPLFGFLMMKRGARSLICCAKVAEDEKFFKIVFASNDISLSKVTILIGDDWTQEVFGDEMYHAVFCNILELCGDIDLRQRELADHLRNKHLLPGGLMMPARVKVVGQVVGSDWLEINNTVYDENVSGLRIASHINRYQVSQNFCVNCSLLEYKAYTSPELMGTIDNSFKTEVVNLLIDSCGDANAILCWYTIQLLDGFEEISTKRNNSFVDATVFLFPKKQMLRSMLARVMRCVDADGSFKLMLEPEADKTYIM